MAAIITRQSQLQWLALLAVAVVLPTVALLWFMSRVVANERLVIRQKLSTLYQDKLSEASTRVERSVADLIAALDKIDPETNPYSLLKSFRQDRDIHSFVMWSADGTLVYPKMDAVAGLNVTPDHPLSTAWQLEFTKQQWLEAAAAYSVFTNDSFRPIAVSAQLGRSRCLVRLGRTPEAIEQCYDAALLDETDIDNPEVRVAAENARLLLLSLLRNAETFPRRAEWYHRTVDALRADVFSVDRRPRLPPTQNLFVARKLLDALQQPIAGVQFGSTEELVGLALAEEASMLAAENARPLSGSNDRIFTVHYRSVFSYGARPTYGVYGLYHHGAKGIVLALLTEEGMEKLLAGYSAAFNNRESSFGIFDAAGNSMTGATPQPRNPFATAPLPEAFPGWKIELYFDGGDVFERAARRQIAVYVWTGVLVILMILVAAALAGQAIGRQIRLNQMKNDFIATVSHELKTPLASMRVLVDTLLEGNVRDEQQSKQYLQLAAKENERLSRMIDNFLTFSRMERNKVAFTMSDTDAADVVHDAVECVQTKFTAHHCQLSLNVARDLPLLHADHDALVTVLVNLLDNACKYTGADKQIGLNVSGGKDEVCFAVTDNGIGIPRRHLRRIFDRFYQVDSSLARRAEGCGLGLSIVKFIVDAHKGKVSVESKSGKGSTFYVRVPANGRDEAG